MEDSRTVCSGCRNIHSPHHLLLQPNFNLKCDAFAVLSFLIDSGILDSFLFWVQRYLCHSLSISPSSFLPDGRTSLSYTQHSWGISRSHSGTAHVILKDSNWFKSFLTLCQHLLPCYFYLLGLLLFGGTIWIWSVLLFFLKIFHSQFRS